MTNYHCIFRPSLHPDMLVGSLRVHNAPSMILPSCEVLNDQKVFDIFQGTVQDPLVISSLPDQIQILSDRNWLVFDALPIIGKWLDTGLSLVCRHL